MSVPVTTHRLTKSYGSARGVEELDLEVRAGEVFGFLGPNGAGKSTTLRTLLDFQRPTSGTAEVFGLDSVRDSLAIRHRVGYLSSDLSLFERLTGDEHVRWFSRARGGHDEAFTAGMVERFGVELHRPIKELSKGNRQKVGLLLAFMHQPELLILDEPTTGLDPLVQTEFDHLLRETTAEGRTVLLSSHSLDEVQRVADRVAIIREGRLVVTDSVEHLRESAARMLTMRFDGEVDPALFRAITGVDEAELEDGQLHLRVSGPIQPVLAAAVDQGVVDLTARHADLDELFLSYYSGEATGAEGAGA
jgi:ABC-2 type transport system ATP-binding protein